MKTNPNMKTLWGKLLGVGLGLMACSLSAQPVITSQPTDQIGVIGGKAIFNVTASGNGPLIYQWQLNGTNYNTNGIITTLVGGPSPGSYGDGGPATNASLNLPYGVAVDATGNVYIADATGSRIRKIDTNGIINTVAGNGTQGFSGDGGVATNANLNQPYGVAVDPAGNVYIADNGNKRVRKVDTNGVITTVAGTGGTGYSGDGGAATSATIGIDSGVAVDASGNLYICCNSIPTNYRVRKVDTNGIISTVAGNGSNGNTGDGGAATNAALSNPVGVAVDSSGNLFISSNYAIRKVNTNGIISTVAGTGTGGFSGDGGPATSATMWSATGIFVDTFGFIYIVDSTSYRIRQVDANGIITTIAGIGSSSPIGDGGYATNAAVYSPRGVTVDNVGNVLIADTSNYRIRKIATGRDPTLRLKNLAAKNAGTYQVIVTATNGSVTSSNALLSLLYPPSVTTQPAYVRASVGSATNLSVAVSGTAPFSYQWFTSSGRTATATPFISGGRITSVLVNDLGMGYTSTPQVHFVGGSGSGATASAFAISGGVVSITVMNQGSGYTTAAPTVQIDPPPMTTTLLTGQTNATLNFSPAALTDGTNYFVVITNNYGSVTSAAAYLWVFVPPQNFSAGNVIATNGGKISLQLSGTPNYPYILQSVTNLTPPVNWKSIRTNNADSNGNWSFTATNLSVTPNLYYRAVGQ